jgi:iron complex outermembrane receptor protein
MKKLTLLFISALLLQMSLSAQYSLSGIITDKQTGETLPGAHIILENTYLTTVSGSKGQYLFTKMEKGNYLLKVSYVGYKSSTREITMEKDTKVNFQLETAAILQDEVVIRGIRTFTEEPPSFTNISSKEIESENMGQDLPYLLSLSPSTVVSSDAGNGVGYTSMRIRGTDMTGINITLNGIPMNDAESHGVWWVNVPDLASSASNIQIQRGVGTSTNGAGAFGASINIQSDKYSAIPYAQINSSYGSFNTFKNNINFGTGLIKGRWSVDGRASFISSDGYIDRATSNLKSFYLSGAYNGEKSIYRFTIFSGKEKTYQAWGGVPKDSLETNRTYNPYTYENETDNYQQDHYQFYYTRELSEHWQLNTALFYVRGRGYYEQYKEDRSFASYGLPDVIIGNDTITSTDLVQQKWLDNNFYGITASVNYSKSFINMIIGAGWNQYDGDHYGEIIWAEYASSMGIDYQWYDNNGLKSDFNIYAKSNFQVTEKFNVYADLQYRMINYSIKGTHDDLRDISQEHNFNFFNPKLGLEYAFNEKHRTYFSFGIANREPNRSAYRDAIMDEEPTFETLYDYELGYKFASPKYAFSANAFYMDYNNQLVLTGKINNVGDPIFTNVQDSYRAGLELQAGMKILKRFSWKLNASFSTNKINNFTSYVDNWDYWNDPDTEPYQYEEDLGTTDISFSPDITAGSLIDYEAIDDLHFSLISTYVGKQYIDNTSNEDRVLDPYFLNNIRVLYTIRTSLVKEINLNFQLNNIFNVEYESNAWVYRYVYEGQEGELNGYFPQAPVNFFVGVGLNF